MQLSFTVVAPSPGSTEDLPRERSTPEREAASATCAAYVVGRERNEQAHVDGQERPHHQLDEQPLGVQALRHGGGSGGQAAGDDDGDDQPDLQERGDDERHAAEAEERPVGSGAARQECPRTRSCSERRVVGRQNLGRSSASVSTPSPRRSVAACERDRLGLASWATVTVADWAATSATSGPGSSGTGEPTVLVGRVRGFRYLNRRSNRQFRSQRRARADAAGSVAHCAVRVIRTAIAAARPTPQP